jgi:hypothetical protein
MFSWPRKPAEYKSSSAVVPESHQEQGAPSLASQRELRAKNPSASPLTRSKHQIRVFFRHVCRYKKHIVVSSHALFDRAAKVTQLFLFHPISKCTFVVIFLLTAI